MTLVRGQDWMLKHGDALPVLKHLKPDRIHGVIQDPPAAIKFMGKEWDSDRGGREQWIEWLRLIQEQTLRVVVPGGWSLTWALPRRSHWTAMALELAVWEIRDIVHHIFGTGMPKGFIKDKKWEGYGTGLKPVTEHWILARKPLREKSVSANLERWLAGALRVGACQVGTNAGWSYPNGKGGSPLHGGGFKDIPCEATKGRYAPHMILGHAPGCALTGTRKVKTGKAHRTKSGGDSFGGSRKKKPQADMTYGDEEGNEVVPVFKCTPGCPVAMIDAQAIAGGMHGAGKKRRGGLGTKRNKSLYRGQGKPDASNGTRFGDQGGPAGSGPPFITARRRRRRRRRQGWRDSRRRTGGRAPRTPLRTRVRSTSKSEGRAGPRKVCGRWRESFAEFISDVGRRPAPELTLDRINNDGDYEPGNVRWATRKTQSRNKRGDLRMVTVDGATKPLVVWAEEVGISRQALRHRIDSMGWSPKKAVSTPVRRRGGR